MFATRYRDYIPDLVSNKFLLNYRWILWVFTPTTLPPQPTYVSYWKLCLLGDYRCVCSRFAHLPPPHPILSTFVGRFGCIRNPRTFVVQILYSITHPSHPSVWNIAEKIGLYNCDPHLEIPWIESSACNFLMIFTSHGWWNSRWESTWISGCR